MSRKSDYTSDDIDPRHMAALAAAPTPTRELDGRWCRRWNIVLRLGAPPPPREALLASMLSNVGRGVIADMLMDFEVKVRVIDCRHIELTVITMRPPTDDDYIFTNGRIFELLDRECGGIETIQGHPRDVWLPWFYKELLGGSLLTARPPVKRRR